MTMTSWIDDIKSGAEPTRQWLEQAQRQAPYSTLPALIYLRAAGVKGNEDILAKLAIPFPDRRALALQLGEDAGTLADFYPPEAMSQTPDTVTTIDRYLDSCGKT